MHIYETYYLIEIYYRPYAILLNYILVIIPVSIFDPFVISIPVLIVKCFSDSFSVYFKMLLNVHGFLLVLLLCLLQLLLPASGVPQSYRPSTGSRIHYEQRSEFRTNERTPPFRS